LCSPGTLDTHTAEPLRIARQNAISLLRATDGDMTAGGSAAEEHVIFLEALLEIEKLAHKLLRTLDIW
jgi:hypothetical protein